MSTYQTIDIRDLKQSDPRELHDIIVQAVKDTQAVVIRELPNELVMTKGQYDILQKEPEMKGMYQSNQYVYITPLNAMEVIIK